jgi:WD40 repeat protein
VSQEVGRRFFIGLGTGRYRNLPQSDQLPQVAGDLTAMREEWRQSGYTPVLAGLGEYDSAAQVREKLSLWSADAELTSSDVVVLYFAGHGVVEEHDRHYLLCWDSYEGACAATALPTEDLVRVLCQGELRNLLIMLDTCAGGVGTAEAAATALRTIAYRQSGDDVQSGLWFLSSARHKDVAGDGAFAAEFPDAVRTVTECTGQRQRFLDLSELVRAVNERFAFAGRSQRAVLANGLVTGLAPFLPNSGFREELPPAGTDLEIQRRVAGQDLAEHFGPRSRGVEFESEQGLYFSGRESVLKQLVEWMADPAGDGKGRVVTGSPGCGKSAVIGRIVALSIDWYRARLDLTDVDPATVVPEDCVTAAVHARHKRLEEIVARIAEALRVTVEGTAGLLQELSRRGKDSDRPIVVIIDALDEAGSGTAADAGGRGEPRRIARELLRPMSDISGVRLLVGTRRELLSALGPTFSVLDLDQAGYRDDEDVAGYVRKVLLAADEPEVPTPYRGNDALAAAVAKGVAKRAAGVFLVARMTARSLRHTTPIEVSKPGWIATLPSEIGSAFDDFLARFGAEEPRVRRMLVPLALAEGHGLPRGQIWSKLSSMLSGIECTEADITWVLEVAQAYIAEVVDDGRSAYRLYHQALAEHLRDTLGPSPTQMQRVQEQVVNALMSIVPVAGDGDRRDWFAAAPYVRLHLATHARVSGQLGSLIEDPGFLLASGQLALLSAFPSITNEGGRRIRTAYEQAAHRLTPDYSPNGRAAELQLSARRCDANVLADQIASLGMQLPWITRWAWWSSTGAHRQLTGHTHDVTCVATGNLDGRPVAVTGSWDKTARVWDLITQQQIGEPLQSEVAISAIAVGELGDYTVALTGGVDGVIRVWDLSAGQGHGTPLTGHTNQIEAIAVGNIGGRAIALTASGDGTARIWDLESRAQIGSPLTAHHRTVNAAALGELGGRPIAVTGGDDRRLYVWDLSKVAAGRDVDHIAPEGSAGDDSGVRQDGGPLIGMAGAVTAVALGRLAGSVVAVVGDDAGMLSLWDLAGRQQIGEPVVAHWYYNNPGVRSIAIGTIDGSPVVLTTGSQDARLWELAGLRQRGHPLRGHVDDINNAALAGGDGLPEGGDRPMGVTVSLDETARIWDLTADQPATGHVREVVAIAPAEINDRSLAITGGADGTARLWDLRSHAEFGRPLEGHTGSVLAVALASEGSRLTAVTAGADATVRIWDASHSLQLGSALEGHTNAVTCLRVIRRDRRLMAVTGSADGTIRLWDVTARQPLGPALTGHIGHIRYLDVWQDDDGIEIVAATRLNHVYIWRVTADMTRPVLDTHLDSAESASILAGGRIVGVAFHGNRPVVLTVSGDTRVRVHDVRGGEQLGLPVGGNSSFVYGAVIGHLEGKSAVAVIDRYDIRLYDLDTGRQIGERFAGSMNGLTSFAFTQVDRSPVGLAAFGSTFQVCDLMTMRPIREPLCGNDMGITEVSIVRSPAGAVIITGADDGTLRTHALSDGRQVQTRFTFSRRAWALAVVPEGQRILGLMSRGVAAIEIWNLPARQQISTLYGDSDWISCIAACEFRDRLIVTAGDNSGKVLAWDLATQTPVYEAMTGHSSAIEDVTACVIGQRPLAASASRDGTVRIWDLQTGNLAAGPFEGHVYGAQAAHLGSLDDQNVVITGDGDGSIRVWDITTGEMVDLHLEAHPNAITAVRMEQIDGRPFAVTADRNGLIRAWDLRAAHCQAEVNVGSGISGIALTPDGDLCVATRMGVAALRLNLAAEPITGQLL